MGGVGEKTPAGGYFPMDSGGKKIERPNVVISLREMSPEEFISAERDGYTSR
jgi:hypothetical protein